MELDWLETFLAVVDCGGFTAAAHQVHRSQSRVSAHIASLERELGVRLLDRVRRPVTVTPAGHIFAAHAREVLAEIGSARSAIDALAVPVAETMSVLTVTDLDSLFLPLIVSKFLVRHPAVRFQVSTRANFGTNCMPTTEPFGMAVLPSMRQVLPPGVQEATLWREPVRVVVPADFALARNGNPVSLEDLSDQHLVLAHEPDTVPERDGEDRSLRSALRSFGLEPRLQTDSPATAIQLVRAGAGIGLLHATGLRSELPGGLRVLNLFGTQVPDRKVVAYWHPALLGTEAGRTLHRIVLGAPVPYGAVAAADGRHGAAGNGSVCRLSIGTSDGGRAGRVLELREPAGA